MSRHLPPVAKAPGNTRARSARPRVHPPRPLAAAQSETPLAADFGLGPLFQHTRDALIVGNVETGVVHQNPRNKPMQSQLPMHLSPRCGAHSTRSGKPCRNGAMKNGRCRMHGGKSTGAPKGNRNGWKHGHYSAQEQARRTALRLLLRITGE